MLGCERSGYDASAPELDHASLDAVLLTGEVLNDASTIGRLYGLVVSGDVLWVKEGAGEPYLHAIDAGSGAILESVGRDGRGPGEFDGAPFVLSADDLASGAVWAFDFTQQRFTLVHPDSAPEERSEIVHLDGTPRVLKAVRLSGNGFLGVSGDSSARFVFFDSTGARVAQVPGSLLGESSAPQEERRKATISFFLLCPHPTAGFVIAYGTAGRVELYNDSVQLTDLASVPFASDVRFARDERTGRTRWVDDRSWYLDCAVTHDHVYTLFAGRAHKDFRRGEASIGRFVHEFAWDDGSLERTFQLDPPVSSIAIDPSGTMLYGASMETATIYRFRLPPMP
jgi:hypothetical protein